MWMVVLLHPYVADFTEARAFYRRSRQDTLATRGGR
jgi:hypothetical protein